jgi:cell division protease FtsH
MVMRFGMSEKLGPRVLGRNADLPFLGRDMGHEPDYSEEVAREIDDEVRRIIEDGHELALKVLRDHTDDLHRISQILIERETIDKDQFERLVSGESEDEVFAEQDAKTAKPEAPAEEPERRPQPKPRPFPLPGSAAMKPPEPEGAN